ncbi:hypothetical protein KVT40_003722 [Elsinoe batatas]|uniref:BTB domain-containing protein n=1 Tax=Elsinoe batatas TaxID=2601811 RepID=A0A8K0L3L3_9PEZI|nr:hypothetical protein KVT40_003722 [Elsinoe batatas]
MEIITLYRDGDVYIAPGTPPLKQYLVSSAVLSNASPVFQAMFSNHFEEGQQLSTAAPKPVSLPEDDPRSVEILLYVMHYHPAAKDMETEEGAAFAQLCDKYGCVESMGSYMNSWLAATWEKYRYEFDEECKLCATAWYFGDAESFRSISSRLVLEHEDSFFKVASEGLYNVPIKLLCKDKVFDIDKAPR